MPRSVVFAFLTFAFFVMALPLPQIFTTGVMCLFLLLDVYYLMTRKAKPDYKYFKWIFAILFVCLMSVLWSIDVKKSIIVIFARMLPVFSVTVFVTLYSQTYKQLEIVLKAFYVSSIIFLFYILTFVDLDLLGEGRLTTAIEDDSLAESLNSNYIAGRMVFALYIGYFIFWKLGNTIILYKILHILISLLMIFVVLMSGSRTSLGIMLLPLLIYYLLKKGNVFKKLLWISAFAIVVLFLVMAIPQFYNIIGVRLEDAFNVATGSSNGSEDTSRLLLVLLGWDWFLQKPFIGYGINCFKVLSANSGLFSAGEVYAHNNYIELLVDVGLIGLFIYYYVHYSLMKCYKKIHLGKKKVGVLVVILLGVMMFSDLFWVGYYNNLSQFLLCITFAIINIEGKKYNIEINQLKE